MEKENNDLIPENQAENEQPEKEESTVHSEEVKEEEIKIDQDKLERYIDELRDEQNLPMALISGLVAAHIGAIIWALITWQTEYQIGFMAVGVGFLTGFAVQFFGKGIDKIYGVIGAVMSLLGCIMGNLFTIVIFASIEMKTSFFTILFGLEFSMIIDILKETFQGMDLLFYGIAIYEGYKFSFRKITEEEINNLVEEETEPVK